MTTAAMQNLWQYIQGLNLSRRNQEWLSQRLIESQKPKVAAKSDPTLMTREEFFAKLDRAEEQHRRGEGIRFSDKSAMHAWLKAL